MYRPRLTPLVVLVSGLVPVPTPAAQSLPVAIEDQDQFVRQKIREHIGHDPLLEIIAGCETTNDPNQIRHWAADGSLVKNPTSSASGAFQVLLEFHEDWITATDKNMQDIDEYMQFVAILFSVQGYDAWYPSEHCWGKYRHLGTS